MKNVLAAGEVTMSRLFQVYEDDLAELERIVPDFSSSMMAQLTPRMRTQLRRCKEILSNIRWNYGPHTEVEVIPADDGPDYELS
jgi:hypothetical protein